MTMAIVQADGFQHKVPQLAAPGTPEEHDIWVPSVPSSKATDPKLQTMGFHGFSTIFLVFFHMAVCQSQNLVPLVNIKIAGKWMFIPLKMVLIGIDPYPYVHSPEGSGL
jgi:hypothetical protein